jgi:hypothetical protein
LIGIVATQTVRQCTEKANSLVVRTCSEEQVIDDASFANVGNVTTGTVVDAAGSTLTNATGEKSSLIASLAEAVGRARGTVN